MKQYESGDCGICFIFSFEGSVILKTLAWAFPSGCLAVAISCLRYGDVDPVIEVSEPKDYKDMAQLWIGFSFMVGFLITFRTGKAYNRWWEGATLLQQARGEWVNAFSNCVAFCSAEPSKNHEVDNFREYLAFLMSLLFSASLNAITQADNNFEVLSFVELPQQTLDYLQECSDPVEVIICWIQTLIIQNMRKSVVDVPPPVLSRVFQELSRGVVNINNVRKISVFLFPFPYAQLIGALLIVFAALTPVVTGLFMHSYLNAFLATFTSVFSLFALNFVAMEIECPFGTDPNDLPMRTMQQYMNRTLELLLMEQTNTVPTVEFSSRTPKRRSNQKWRDSGLGSHDELDGPHITSTPSTSKRRQSITKRKDVDFAPRSRGLGKRNNFRSSDNIAASSWENSQMLRRASDRVQEYGNSDRAQEHDMKFLNGAASDKVADRVEEHGMQNSYCDNQEHDSPPQANISEEHAVQRQAPALADIGATSSKNGSFSGVEDTTSSKAEPQMSQVFNEGSLLSYPKVSPHRS